MNSELMSLYYIPLVALPFMVLGLVLLWVAFYWPRIAMTFSGLLLFMQWGSYHGSNLTPLMTKFMALSLLSVVINGITWMVAIKVVQGQRKT